MASGGVDAIVAGALRDGMEGVVVTLPKKQVVFFKGVIEASDGVAMVVSASRASRGGARPSERTRLTLLCTASMRVELDRLVADLAGDVDLEIVGPAVEGAA